MSDLKPCPFCGGSACLDAATSKADDGTLIEYPGCEGRCAAAVGSVEVWESRPIEARLAAESADLKRLLAEAEKELRFAHAWMLEMRVEPAHSIWLNVPAVRRALEGK